MTRRSDTPMTATDPAANHDNDRDALGLVIARARVKVDGTARLYADENGTMRFEDDDAVLVRELADAVLGSDWLKAHVEAAVAVKRTRWMQAIGEGIAMSTAQATS